MLQRTVRARVPARRGSLRHRETWVKWAALAILVPGALVVLSPFAWMVSVSFEHLHQLITFPPVLVPSPFTFSPWAEGFTSMPFLQYFVNSLFVALMSVAGGCLSTSLAGYAFARLRFPRKNLIFVGVLSMMMIPSWVTLIPQFILFKDLDWINTFYPLWVPQWFGVGAFFIFLFRQFFLTIPEDIFEAARLDGCGYLASYGRVLVPLSLPAFASSAILMFLAQWQDFVGPLIYINGYSKYTLPLALANMQATLGASPWNQIMAMAVLASLPPIVLFFVAQRYIITGIVVTQK